MTRSCSRCSPGRSTRTSCGARARPSASTPSASTSRSARAGASSPTACTSRSITTSPGSPRADPDAPNGVTVGFAAPRRLEQLPNGFAQASRALQTALAFGQQGAFSLADLSIRPAILADEALGDAFAERHLTPIAGLGMELEETLRTYLDLGMKIDDTARDAARARQHAAAPAAPLRGGDGRQLAGSARRRGTLVGARAPAPPNLNTMFTRATALIVIETVVLVAAITSPRSARARPTGSPCRWCFVLLALALTSDLFAVGLGGQRISGLLPRARAGRRAARPRPGDRDRRRRRALRSRPRAQPAPALIANLAAFATFPLVGGLLFMWELETWDVPLDSTAFPLLVFAVFMVTNFLNFLMIGGHHAFEARVPLAGSSARSSCRSCRVRSSARCCARSWRRSTCRPASRRWH